MKKGKRAAEVWSMARPLYQLRRGAAAAAVALAALLALETAVPVRAVERVPGTAGEAGDISAQGFETPEAAAPGLEATDLEPAAPGLEAADLDTAAPGLGSAEDRPPFSGVPLRAGMGESQETEAPGDAARSAGVQGLYDEAMGERLDLAEELSTEASQVAAARGDGAPSEFLPPIAARPQGLRAPEGEASAREEDPDAAKAGEEAPGPGELPGEPGNPAAEGETAAPRSQGAAVSAEPLAPLREGEDVSRAALTLRGDYYVTDAAQQIDRTGLEGYPEATVDNMALYTAIRDDMEFERHGGVYYSGHEVLRYAPTASTVYSGTEYEAYLNKDAAAKREERGPDWGSASHIVFALAALPVTYHPQFSQKFDVGNEVIELSVPNEDKQLFAWEYEATGSGSDRAYQRVGEHAIQAEEVVFTEPRLDPETGLQPSFLSGAVKLSGSWMKDPSNPVAIVARLYDSTAHHEKKDYFWSIWNGDAEANHMVFDPDFFSRWNTDDDYYLLEWVDLHYRESYNFYMDDAFSNENLGSFDLMAYDYWVDEEAETVTLLDASPYNSFAYLRKNGGGIVRSGKLRRGDDYDYTLPEWRIPAKTTYKGKEYQVVLEGGNDGKVPSDAKSLTVEGGVVYPRDAYGLFGHGTGDLVNYVVLNPLSDEMIAQYDYPILTCPLEHITIGGNGARSVGGCIENMFGMFNSGSGNTAAHTYDITALDTSGTVSMKGMFTGNTFAVAPDLSKFNTSKVTDMTGMFADCVCETGTIDLKAFDTSQVWTMFHTFAGLKLPAGSVLDLSVLDTSQVLDMGEMFQAAQLPYGNSLKLDGKFDTSRVVSMKYMFAGIGSQGLTLDVSHLKTGNVTDMTGMFEKTSLAEVDVSAFDFHNVETMESMFSGGLLKKITLPPDMDSRKVRNMNFLFMGTQDLQEIANLTAMDTDSVEWMMGMFAPQLGQRYVSFGAPPIWSDYKNGKARGTEAPNLQTLDLSHFNTKQVTDARLAFYNPNVTEVILGPDVSFPKLASLDPRKHGNPASAAHRLFHAQSLERVDLSGMSFESLPDASGLFMENQSMTELVLDGVDLSGTVNGGSLLLPMPLLESLDLSGVKMNQYTLGYGSLADCTKLSELILPTDCPTFASPVKLPRMMFDEAGNVYETVRGGNREELHLMSSLGDPVDEVRIQRDDRVVVLDRSDANREREYLYTLLYRDGTPYNREVLPAVDHAWELSEDIATLEQRDNFNRGAAVYVNAVREGEAVLTVTARTESGTYTDRCQVRVVDSAKMYKTKAAASDGSSYFVYPLGDGTYELTGLDRLSGKELDLSKIDPAYPIRRIGNDAFSYDLYSTGPLAEEDGSLARYKSLQAVESLTIPASVEEIGAHPFGLLSNAREIHFEGGGRLKAIGYQGFAGIGGSLDPWSDKGARVQMDPLPESLREIGSYAFSGLSIERIVLPEGVEWLGYGVFKDCAYLKSANLPRGLARIPSNLFSGCARLEQIHGLSAVLAHVREIGDYAFSGTGSYPGSDETVAPVAVDIEAADCVLVGTSAFADCYLVKSFAGPKVARMGASAFNHAKHLVSASLPILTEIPSYAFGGDVALERLEIPAAVILDQGAVDLKDTDSRYINPYSQRIPKSYPQTQLTAFAIPAGVTYIGDNALRYVDAPMEIPAGVTYIGAGAFEGCYGLTEVKIPSSVQTLGEGAFALCGNLRTAALPGNLTEIPNRLFYYCTNLEEVRLPDTVEEIGGEAFTQCSLRRLPIPAGLKTMSNSYPEVGTFYHAFEGSLRYRGGKEIPGEGGVRALVLPYGMERLEGSVMPFQTKSGYDADNAYYCSYLEEIWIPETVTELGKLAENLYANEGAGELLCYDMVEGEAVPRGSIFYGGTREAFRNLVGDAQMGYLERDNAEIHYESGWHADGEGNRVFRMDGEVIKDEIRQIGDAWYQLDAAGSFTVDRALVSGGYVYYFDGYGRGDRSVLSGDGVYPLFDGRICVLVQGGDVVIGASTGSASAEGLVLNNGCYYHPHATGTLALGYRTDEAGDGFYFDDCLAEDGRLLWRRSGDVYYADAAKGARLTGRFPDEAGELTDFTDGRRTAIQGTDLSIQADPAALYVNGDATPDSQAHPSAGSLRVTVAGGFTARSVTWSVAANAPRINGSQVVELSGSGTSAGVKALAAGSARVRATVTDERGDTAYAETILRVADLRVLPMAVTVTAAGGASSVKVGETLQMGYQLSPEGVDPAYDRVSWSVSWNARYRSGGYAEIDEKGLLTAKKLGYYDNDRDSVTLTVTATTRNVIRGTYAVTITKDGKPPVVPDVPVVPDAPAVSSGSGLDGTAVPEGSGRDLTYYLVKGQTAQLGKGNWRSSDKTVAAVTSAGKITAKKAGAATITGTPKGAAAEIEVRVHVAQPVLKYDGAAVKKRTLLVGEASEPLTVDLGDAPSSKYPVAWVSSNEKVATVRDGAVTGIAKGSTRVSAYVGGKAYACTISVTDNPTALLPKKLGASAELRLNPLQSYTPKYEAGVGFKPNKATWQQLSDGGLVPLEEIKNKKGAVTGYKNGVLEITASNGKLKAIGPGSATIVGTSAGSGASVTLTVTVAPTASKAAVYLLNGKSETLKYQNVKNAQATWSTLAPGGGTASGLVGVRNGKVTAGGSGTGEALVRCAYLGFTWETTVYVEAPALRTDGKLRAGTKALTYALSMKRGETYDLRAEEGKVFQKLSWKSGKAAAVFVDENGRLYARQSAKAVNLTARLNGKTIKVTVRVEP